MLGAFAAAVASAAGSAVHAAGVSVLEVSPCGGALVAAGSAGGLRVYETRSWRWQSWPKLGRGSPCVAAAWSGAPALSDECKTLVLAMRGEASLHVIRIGRRKLETGTLTADYVGHVDLGRLCPLHPTMAPAPDPGAGQAEGGVARGRIVSLAWEPRGERLAVGWAGPRAAQRPDNEPAAAEAGGESGGVTVLSTRALPTLQAHTIGNLQTAPGKDCARLRDVAFASAVGPLADFRTGAGNGGVSGGGCVGGGTVLSVGWLDGRISLVPLYF